MFARKCDRCGKFYEKNTFRNDNSSLLTGMCFFSDATMLRNSLRDLCDDCLKALTNWLSNNESKGAQDEQ